MALIKGFRSTSVWKAFALNSIATTLVIFLAMLVKGQLDTYKDKNGETITHDTNFKSIVVTLLVTFATSMVAYTFMYLMFGFGGGMLVNV